MPGYSLLLICLHGAAVVIYAIAALSALRLMKTLSAYAYFRWRNLNRVMYGWVHYLTSGSRAVADEWKDHRWHLLWLATVLSCVISGLNILIHLRAMLLGQGYDGSADMYYLGAHFLTPFVFLAAHAGIGIVWAKGGQPDE